LGDALAVHDLPFVAAQLFAEDLGAAHKQDLVVRDPATPAGALGYRARARAVRLDRQDVPLVAVVGVSLADPALLAAAKQNSRSVRRKARKPIDRIAARDLLDVRAVRLHREQVVIAEARARPDDQARSLGPDLLHGGGLFERRRVVRAFGWGARDRRARSKRARSNETQRASAAQGRSSAQVHGTFLFSDSGRKAAPRAAAGLTCDARGKQR